MTDPTRWGALNESEREVLRAARETRNAKASWIILPSDGAARAWGTAEGRLTRATNSLADYATHEAPIELPEGWALLPETDDQYAHIDESCGETVLQLEGDTFWAPGIQPVFPVAAAVLLLRASGRYRVEVIGG